MYYYKNLLSAKEAPKINFSHYWRNLDFRELMTYPENKEALAKWLSDYPPGAPNLAAAVFTQVHYRHPLDNLITIALHYCNLILDERGYEPTSADELGNKASVDTNHVVLVTGCQGREVLKSRAKAAYELLANVRNIPFDIVFAGKNPSGAGTGLRVQTSNEALFLKQEFCRLVDSDASFRGRHNFITFLENKSSKSEENLSNFFLGSYLRKDKPTTLFLVSSTFHGPRLAKIAENQIGKDETLKKLVTKLVVIGAEDSLSENSVVGTSPYLKWMMYEVFEHLLANSPRNSI